MSKFYGRVGFTVTEETAPGIWDVVETDRFYTGDVTRSQRRWENSSPNEDYTVSNEISLLIDDFVQENAGSIKWVELMGSKWKVNSVTLEYPRLRLTLGGVYNGG